MENWFCRILLWKFVGEKVLVINVWWKTLGGNAIFDIPAFQKYSIHSVLEALCIFSVSVSVPLSLHVSFCKSSSRSLSSPDDKLSENIWFVWSRTSYSGYKLWEGEGQPTKQVKIEQL